MTQLRRFGFRFVRINCHSFRLQWTPLLLTFWLLSGCTSIPQPDWSQIPVPWRTQDSTNTPNDPLTLLVWNEGEQTDLLRRLLADFEAQTPGITVELIVAENYEAEVQRRTAEETLTDLLLVDSFRFPTLVADNVLAPAQGRLDATDDFYPILVDSFLTPNGQYCLPREFRTLALVYAQANFAAEGLLPPTTWDEVRLQAEVLTDLNTGSFGLILSPDLSRWLPWLYQAGGSPFDENGEMAFDSAPASTAIDFYITIFRDNFAGQPGESNSSWAGEVLGKGEGSMTFEGNWIVPYFADLFPNFSYGVAPLPSGPGGRGTVAFTSCYAVTTAAERPDDAFALANFLTSRDAMQQWTNTPAFMPTRISLRANWLQAYPALSPFMEGLTDARVWQLPDGFDTFLRTFNRSLLNLYDADIEAAAFLDNMQRLGTLILER